MQLLADNSVLNETKVLKKYFLDNLTGFIKLKIKGYLEASEVPDFLRGLGFYLSNYEAACISNELLNEGKRTVYFDDVVKIYLNYSPISEIEKTDIISAIKNVLASQRNISQHDFDEAKIKSSEIKNILKNSGEKVDGKDADNYLKEFFSIDNKDSLPDEIDLPDFINKLIGY
jgi:Ca2+-binding EF-hand superfamily protein